MNETVVQETSIMDWSLHRALRRCADVILSAAARRVILTGGGGAPIDFFSAAAASVKCRRRESQEWSMWA